MQHAIQYMTEPAASDGLESTGRRLRDYASVGVELFVQRLIIYSAAIFLAGAYYSWIVALVFYTLVLACEAYDLFVFRNIIDRRIWKQADIRKAMLLLHTGTIISSTVISFFAISFALQQESGSGHFMPMFMLVSASIFAAMNNHHFFAILITRLIIYVSAIIAIPVYDVWHTAAPLDSENWLNLFTVVFVLGFLVELARQFLAGYSKSLQSRSDLEQEHELTKSAFIAKSDFLSTVSHELRTPLTSIKGSLSLMASGAWGPVPDKMIKPLIIARKNTTRLEGFVEDLLFMQRSDAGKLVINSEKVDLGKLVQETAEAFQPYADTLGVNLHVDIVTQKFWTLCDGKRIAQVITNILSNAAKFSNRNGNIFVFAEIYEGQIRISISDEGIGIANGSYGKVFEEFGQMDTSSTRQIQGSGLGLNISKRIIDAHNGNISYNSTLGVGSTFFIELKVLNLPLSA